MELMATCMDKLVKRIKAPIPEAILGKMAVSVRLPVLAPHHSLCTFDLCVHGYGIDFSVRGAQRNVYATGGDP